jgi:predicted nuclease of predicted toxin-antitoxin system
VVRVASELTPAGWLSFRIAVMKSFVEPVPVTDYAVLDYAGNARVLTAHDLDLSEIAVTFGLGIHL